MEVFEEHPASNYNHFGYRTALGYMKNNVFVIGSNDWDRFFESDYLRIETFSIGDHAWKSRDIEVEDELLCQK